MYFFRLKTLLAELQAEPANDSRTFKYFFVFSAIITSSVLLNILKPKHFSTPVMCLFIAISLVKLVGLIVCYIVNGGKNGKYFFHRYFPVSWVLLFRIFIPLAVLLYLLATAIVRIIGVNITALSQVQINIINSIEALIVTTIYWWYVVINIRSLAKKPT